MKQFGQLWLLAGLVCAIAPCALAAPPISVEPVLEELTRIEQITGLVSSARAEFSVRFLSPNFEEQQKRRLFDDLGQQSGVYNANFSNMNGFNNPRDMGRGDNLPIWYRRDEYQAIWYRKGEMEREERNVVQRQGRPATAQTIVFDGKQIKTLEESARNSRWVVEQPSGAWANASRIEPFAFAFEFRALSHAEIVRRSPERRVSRTAKEDGLRIEVVARHPSERTLQLRLVYDEQFRLLSRETISSRPAGNVMRIEDGKTAVISKYEFSGHKPYDDGQGNTVWFPSRAVLRYFVGALPDGSPVLDYAMQVEITKFDLNCDLTDDRFALRRPQNGNRMEEFPGDPYSSFRLGPAGY